MKHVTENDNSYAPLIIIVLLHQRKAQLGGRDESSLDSGVRDLEEV